MHLCDRLHLSGAIWGCIWCISITSRQFAIILAAWSAWFLFGHLQIRLLMCECTREKWTHMCTPDMHINTQGIYTVWAILTNEHAASIYTWACNGKQVLAVCSRRCGRGCAGYGVGCNLRRDAPKHYTSSSFPQLPILSLFTPSFLLRFVQVKAFKCWVPASFILYNHDSQKVGTLVRRSAPPRRWVLLASLPGVFSGRTLSFPVLTWPGFPARTPRWSALCFHPGGTFFSGVVLACKGAPSGLPCPGVASSPRQRFCCVRRDMRRTC